MSHGVGRDVRGLVEKGVGLSVGVSVAIPVGVAVGAGIGEPAGVSVGIPVGAVVGSAVEQVLDYQLVIDLECQLIYLLDLVVMVKEKGKVEVYQLEYLLVNQEAFQ